jgi:uncharacterized protein (TIGR02145 family)
VGKYTYVRNSLKEGCEWAPSNLFTVEVITCGPIADDAPVGTMGTFKDSRDNRVYKIVMMPDEKIWFAGNLNYQKDLVFNQRSDVANGVPFVTADNGTPAIGSFWCPAISNAVASADTNTCGVYGALYTWETAMMVDGKYSDELQSTDPWDESWVSSNYFNAGGAPASTNKGNTNNARGDGSRGICPDGWYVPTDYDWANLFNKVEGTLDYTTSNATGWWGASVGVELKSASTYLENDPGDGSWLEHANRGIDTWGFNLLPSGFRFEDGSSFSNRAMRVFQWSSSVRNTQLAFRRYFGHEIAGQGNSTYYRSTAGSIRCVRLLP